ncbi:hypothetical protein [Bradyrhizobium sp. HKCCYLS20291]|uniref:hypothetical protein n=1 Tax=Bradyrhizobium sp. HKCCYLS20291 TaxID=3420766 RepID=UPI003EBAE786
MSGIYGDEFERNLNVLTGPANIRATAAKFVAFEKEHGTAYSFGMFIKALMPRPADWADQYGSTRGFGGWEKHAGAIPKELRERLTSVTFANYRAENPRPVRFKIGSNVDASYDVQIKHFMHDGVEHIGVLILCPNPELAAAAPAAQGQTVPA